MNIQSTSIEQTALTLPKGYFKNIPIAQEDVSQGITSKFLKEIWKSVSCNLVEGEYKNLWALLHKKADMFTISQNYEQGLKYVFPALLELSAKGGYTYLNVLSNSNSAAPEMARQAGLTHRYMTIHEGISCLCSVKRLKEGKDNWPTFRASKESISAIVIIKSLKGKEYVILGKNKPNLNNASSSRPVGTITGYVNPNESHEKAVKRELQEETGLEIPDQIESNLVGYTDKRDYYPGADDRNEVRVIRLNLADHHEFELKKVGSKELGNRYWTLIQHKTVEIDGQSEIFSSEIKAADDLAEVYILPFAEALNKMKPGTSGRAKVQAAYQAVHNNSFLQEQIVSFGWASKLQSYDDVVLTSPVTVSPKKELSVFEQLHQMTQKAKEEDREKIALASERLVNRIMDKLQSALADKTLPRVFYVRYDKKLFGSNSKDIANIVETLKKNNGIMAYDWPEIEKKTVYTPFTESFEYEYPAICVKIVD